MISLGIDCGTQSTKVIALDLETGRVIASASKPHDLIAGLPPGHMEQHPEDWRDAADEAIRAVLSKLGDRASDVRAIGVSGQQHGLVVLDGQGAVVRPAKLWCDTSTAGQCREITDHFGGTGTLIEMVGNAMLPGFTAPKILWLRENEPDNWAKTKTVLLPHDYLNWWLTGHAAMEYGDASGTALLDVRKREWAPAVVDFIASDLAEKLPPLQSSLKPVGTLRGELLEKWGLRGPVVVSAGGGDNMMGAIGTGNTTADAVTASLGTSGTLFACAAEPVVDPQGEVAGFCDSTDQWLPLICTMNVTLVTELARKLFDLSHDAVDDALGRTAAGANGLLLLPYLVGERTPNLPDGCGVLHGLRVSNFTQDHLLRACVEGVTLGLGYGLNRLRQLGIAPSEIRLTGGGSHSRAWRQIAANIFETPVVCLDTGEGAALGGAIQAAWAESADSRPAGESLHEFAARFVKLDESSRVEPQRETFETYRSALEKSATLRSALGVKGLI